jgi:uncharacterized protein (DUF362 family)
MKCMKRRDFLAISASAPLVRAEKAPTAPVAIEKCADYGVPLVDAMDRLFDKIGGLGRIVRGKTVTVKVNLTGHPGQRLGGKALGSTHYTHPATIGAMAHLLYRAGAKRTRFVESAWHTGGPSLEEYMLDSGWNVRRLLAAAPNVEFENTNALGLGKRYARLKVAHGGYIFPSFDLNHAYEDTDVMVSMAKLKNHATCGVTLSMKNLFGATPAAIYGDDAGVEEPNENPRSGRGAVCHFGRRQPSRSAAPEKDPRSPRDAFYRMPRITVDVVGARPIDLAFIDGIETMTGGEGPWVRGPLSFVKPGVLIAGTNPVTTDTVATAVMGYDPRAPKGVSPFTKCDNTLLLAEAAGIGSADLANIEVAGVSIAGARFPFPAL